jgi:hypothetical protein
MLLGKRLELLHELVPKASIIGILVNPDAADAEPEIGEVTAAAQTLGQRIQGLSASGDAAIETASRLSQEGTVVQPSAARSSSAPAHSSPATSSSDASGTSRGARR